MIKLIIKTISLFLIMFILILEASYADHGHGKYHDKNGKKATYTNKSYSETKAGYCYKIYLNNETSKNIYNWTMSFEVDSEIQITSKWGFTYTQEGNKYYLKGISWNRHLKRGYKNMEVGFCAKGTSKPKNIIWGDENNYEYIDEELECDDYKNKTSCEEGNAKVNCSWENNKCIKKDTINDDEDTSTGICNTPKETISDINLVKNHSFEDFNEGNIIKKWWFRILNFFLSSFTGKFKEIPYWTSSNGDYKIWKNNDETKAIDGKSFIEITDLNKIYQNIQTEAGKKYKLSFYTIGNDELSINWNGTNINKRNSTGNWEKKEFILDGKDGTSKLEFQNSKENHFHNYSTGNIDPNSCPKKEEIKITKVIDYDKVAELGYIVENGKIYENKTSKVIDYDKVAELGYIVENGKIYENKTVDTIVSGNYYNINKNLGKNSNYTINIDANSKKVKMGFYDFIEDSHDDKNGILKIDLLSSNGTIVKTYNQEPFEDNCNWWNWWYCDTYREAYYESNDIFSKVKFTTNSKAILYIDNRYVEQKKSTLVQKIEISTDKIPMKDIVTKTELSSDKIPMKEVSETILVPDMDKCIADDKEVFTETHLRLAIDNVIINEVTISDTQDKINLMTLITEELLNKTKINSCQSLLNDLGPKLQSEIIERLISGSTIEEIVQEYYLSILESTKYEIVKNISYEEIKTYITDCHTEEEKNTFYEKVYNLSIADIGDCTLNNLEITKDKQINNINYLKSVTNMCSQSGNTINLQLINQYNALKK